MDEEKDILNFTNNGGTNPKASPYHAPHAYFENNAKNILQKIDAADNDGRIENSILNIAAFKESPYQADAGYFEQLPNTILSKIATPKKAKIFRLKYKSGLVAAMFIGVVSLSLYFSISHHIKNQQQISKANMSLNTISDEELAEAGLDFLPENNMDNDAESYKHVADLVKDVADNDIETFLHNTQQMEPSVEENL